MIGYGRLANYPVAERGRNLNTIQQNVNQGLLLVTLAAMFPQ